jgi:hypothetical protein
MFTNSCESINNWWSIQFFFVFWRHHVLSLNCCLNVWMYLVISGYISLLILFHSLHRFSYLSSLFVLGNCRKNKNLKSYSESDNDESTVSLFCRLIFGQIPNFYKMIMKITTQAIKTDPYTWSRNTALYNEFMAAYTCRITVPKTGAVFSQYTTVTSLYRAVFQRPVYTVRIVRPEYKELY